MYLKGKILNKSLPILVLIHMLSVQYKFFFCIERGKDSEDFFIFFIFMKCFSGEFHTFPEGSKHKIFPPLILFMLILLHVNVHMSLYHPEKTDDFPTNFALMGFLFSCVFTFFPRDKEKTLILSQSFQIL